MKKSILFLLLMTLPFSLFALEKPKPDEARKVVNYFYGGNDPILMEHLLCKSIGKNGAQKNECVDEVDPERIDKGEKVYLWMKFLVPSEKKAKLLVQFSCKRRVLKTSEPIVTSAYRYRTWLSLPTKRAGSCNITIEQERKDDFVKMVEIPYRVLKL